MGPQGVLGVLGGTGEGLGAVGPEGGLGADLLGQADGVDHPGHVGLSLVEGVADDRLRGRIVGGEAHRAAALRRQQAGRDPDAVRLRVPHPLFDDVDRGDVELHVGRLGAGADPGEAAGLGQVGGEGAGLGGLELRHRRRLQRRQQALGLGRGEDGVGGGMVAEVLAHRRLVEQQLDFAHRQVLGRADAGEHQQLRRVVGAAAEDDLALGAELLHLAELAGLDPDRAGALEEHAVDVHVGHHGQVWALSRRVQVGDGGARPHAAALGHLVHADAVLLGAVEVLVAGQARLHPGLDEGGRDLVAGALIGDRQRPADRVPLARRRARCPRP